MEALCPAQKNSVIYFSVVHIQMNEIPTHLFWRVIARSFSDAAISKQMPGMTIITILK